MAYMIRRKKTNFVVLLTLAVTFLVYTLYHSPNPVGNKRVFLNQNISDIVSPNAGTQNLHNLIMTSLNFRTSSNPSGSSRRKITVELVGSARLGNLMFGYASMLGLADRNVLDPVFSSKNKLLLASFDISLSEQTIQLKDWFMVQERFACAYDDSVNEQISHSNRSVLLFGYFQSWRYFDNIRERIIKEFRFRRSFSEKAEKFIETATLKHYPNSAVSHNLSRNIMRIGIHVRRGDMLAATSIKKGMTVASAEYFRRAMTYVEERLINDTDIRPLPLLYIVVSDDIKWCKDNIVPSKYPIEFGSGYAEPSIDMAILASCNHTIVTVGTFSWWAGYLAGGITVYYKDFPTRGSETAAIFRAEDYFPPTWIGLS